MKVQSSNYIQENKFSKNDIVKEEIKTIKEEIKCHEEIKDINKNLVDTLEKGLAELAPFKAYCIEQLRLNANTAYNSSNSISNELNKVGNLHNKVNEFKATNQGLNISEVEPLDNKAILREADLRLELGNTKEALKGYNKIIFNRENKPVPDNYRPIEEKLRQASRLYMDFQPLVENLNINNALKLKLYCTGIAAHTTGIFSLSKAEVLHMINNQFFYESIK